MLDRFFDDIEPAGERAPPATTCFDGFGPFNGFDQQTGLEVGGGRGLFGVIVDLLTQGNADSDGEDEEEQGHQADQRAADDGNEQHKEDAEGRINQHIEGGGREKGANGFVATQL